MSARSPILRLVYSRGELIVDNFAGGGGASEGLRLALGRDPDVAINHDAEALAMHRVNHPATRHYCESVWQVDPLEVCAGKRVGVAWFSPDCTWFSKARGAAPHRDKRIAARRRGLAWVVTRWARAFPVGKRPRVLFLENVEEFQDWGPMGNDGRPDPLKLGFTFRRWVAQLEGLGYVVEWRELRACDYGAPTMRKRLFVIARCDGQPIVWPEATHGPEADQPWEPAAGCIDFERPVRSIFGRRRPLADKTMRRVARGLVKFVLGRREPFIVPLRGTSSAHTSTHSLLDPLATVSAQGTHHALLLPFTAPLTHAGDERAHDLREPFRTITGANRGETALFSPLLIQCGYGERAGQAPRVLDLHAPLNTIVPSNKFGLVSAFLARNFGRKGTPGNDLRGPVGTVTSRDHTSLVTALLGPRAGQHAADVRELLAKYGHDDDNTLELDGAEYVVCDVGMRMLEARELFNAQGFRRSYILNPYMDAHWRHDKGRDVWVKAGPLCKTSQIRMCGNSVSPHAAAALVAANMGVSPALEEVA